MDKREVIVYKLGKLLSYLGELQEFRDVSADEYKRDVKTRRIVERLLTLIVEVAVDIGSLALLQIGKQPPGQYFQTFVDLGTHGVIDPDLSNELAPSAGLRNRLTHEYDRIDDEIVYMAIKTVLRLYPEFVREVRQFLTRC